MAGGLPLRVSRRVANTLSLLLAPAAYSDGRAWREDAARDLRCLVGADAAFIAVDDPGGATASGIDLDDAILRAYRAHYADVDLGMARQRCLGIEVWCRRGLWAMPELIRSEYYNDFARPNRLMDSFGVAVASGAQRVRISLLCERASSPARTSARLALLNVVLPAFRAGVGLSAWDTWDDCATRLLNGVDQPLALCDERGQEVYRNGALERAAGVVGERLLGAIEHVTRTVAATAHAGGNENPSVSLVTQSGEWCVRGSSLPWREDRGAASSRILVSLARQARAPIRTAEMRERYQLTQREAEVLELLRRRRSNAEIAEMLHISAHTARHHTANILQKLGVHSRNDVERRLALESASRTR